jgi:hypothetical protein
MSKTTTIILVVLGCLLLAVASFALWATVDIFNAGRFGDHVAAGLQSPESTAALAEPIVDRLMASYPDLPDIARGPAEEAVAWMLQRPLFTPVFKGVAAGAVFKGVAAGAIKVMTTSAEDVVGIDIAEVASNAGSTVLGVISAINPDAAANAEAALDDAIATSEESGRLAIYEQGRFPELRQVSNLAPWLALLAGLGAIALFVYSYIRAQNQHSALKYIGVGIMTTAVLGFLLLAPVVQAVAQNNITNPTMQIVVGEVVSVLVRAYAVQSLLVFSIGAIVLIVNHVVVDQDAPAAETETAPATAAPAPADQPAQDSPASTSQPSADPSDNQS